ncbi:MAG: VanZ family protein [Acidimicrobiales bacterium]
MTRPEVEDLDDQRDSAAGPKTRWLVIGLAVMIALGIVLSRRPRLPQIPAVDNQLAESLAHVVLAAVLALVAVVLAERRGIVAPALAGIAAVAGVTTAIELGQLSLADRSTTVDDLVANMLGAILGAGLAVALRRVRPSAAGRVVLAVMLFVIGAEVAAIVAEATRNDTCDQVVSPAIDKALRPPRPADLAPILSYDLSQARSTDEGFEVPADGGGPPLLGLDDQDLRLSPDGLVFGDGGSVLSSEAGGPLLSAALEQGGTVFVEVAARPSQLTFGPARIVAVSAGSRSGDVNIHIGQHREELSVRLRLGCGEFNWTRIDDVFTGGDRRHVIMTFADGVQRVWVDDRLVDERRFVGDGAAIENWDKTMPLVVGNTPTRDRAFFGEIELVTVGVVRTG